MIDFTRMTRNERLVIDAALACEAKRLRRLQLQSENFATRNDCQCRMHEVERLRAEMDR